MKENSDTNSLIDKREFNGHASLLLGVRLLDPLAEFPFATRSVSEHLHSLGYGWYLLVGDRPSVEDGLPTETVRVCMVVWARDVAAAMLATRCEDAVGRVAPESPNSLPPLEILFPQRDGAMESLLRPGAGR